MADSPLDRLLAPRVILPLLLIVIVGITLFAPTNETDDGLTRLSTQLNSRGGAKGLFETMRRLGWQAKRRESMLPDSGDSGAVHALLAPVVPMTAREVHTLLDLVRNGDGLFLVPGASESLLDSLHMDQHFPLASGRPHAAGGLLASIPFGSECGDGAEGALRPGGGVESTLRHKSGFPADTVAFATAILDSAPEVVAVGFPLGRGRVAVVAQGRWFRNDVLRQCNDRYGVLAVRMFEWLSGSGERVVIFDEYHHGFGNTPSTTRVVRRALFETPAGRALSQIIFAALVLIAAIGIRPIAPRERERIERRSPFEHVGALARAYEQIGATRRGSKLLVRGLRRRHDAAAWRHGTDADFLRAVAVRYRIVAEDVDTVLGAIERESTPVEFIEVGEALERIERTMSRE